MARLDLKLVNRFLLSYTLMEELLYILLEDNVEVGSVFRVDQNLSHVHLVSQVKTSKVICLDMNDYCWQCMFITHV